MRKWLLFFLTALCLIYLFFKVPEETADEKDETAWVNIAIDFWNMSISESVEKRIDHIGRAVRDLNSANVETFMKYRIMRILSYVESHPDDDVSETILSNVKQLFGGSVMRSERQFFAFCQKMYADHLSQKSDFYGERKENRSPRGIDAGFISKVLCEGLSAKYEKSLDGTIWLYGENYFAAYSSGELPDYILMSPKGSADRIFEKKFSSRPFFERKGSVVFSEEAATDKFSTVKVYDERFPDNFILLEKSPLKGKIVFFDFSSFKFSIS